MARDLGLEVSTSVTPALHPQNVASLDEYDDDTAGHLQQAVDAFNYAYLAVAQTHDAREAVRNDPSMTEAAQIIRTSDHADKLFKTASSQLDRVHANMKTGIGLIEKEFATPLQARAAHTLSVEIRGYVHALKERGGSPMDFVRQAIERGDHDTVSAVLGAPPYLSGIEPAAQSILLRMWHEKADPVSAKRLRAMQGVVELIQSNGPLLHSELEKAVGAKPHEVRKLREAKARSDKAFGS